MRLWRVSRRLRSVAPGPVPDWCAIGRPSSGCRGVAPRGTPHRSILAFPLIQETVLTTSGGSPASACSTVAFRFSPTLQNFPARSIRTSSTSSATTGSSAPVEAADDPRVSKHRCRGPGLAPRWLDVLCFIRGLNVFGCRGLPGRSWRSSTFSSALAALLLGAVACTVFGQDQVCAPSPPTGVMRPERVCAFVNPPPGDSHPGHTQVHASPVVFPIDGEVLIAAVFSEHNGSWNETDGVLRILRTSDCSLVATLGSAGPALITTFQPAAADLDGDGRAEVVTAAVDGSTVAWTSTQSGWEPQPLWQAPLEVGMPWAVCNLGTGRCPVGWGGLSIHDLDDDGSPEVIRSGVVWSSVGQRLAFAPPGYGQQAVGDNTLQLGDFPLIANLDYDPSIEITDGAGLWQWLSTPFPSWAIEPGFVSAASGAGHVGVGDMVTAANEPAPQPELVLVQKGSVQILANDGGLVNSQVFPLPGQESQPVLADTDGDGLLEVGVTNGSGYTMFDLDCGPTPRPGGVCAPGICDALAGNCPPGVAWSRPVQDVGSSRTPALAFDFEDDGASEIVFADECYTRGFDGAGRVVFSRHRASCTFHDGPVIATAELGAQAVLIVPNNTACGASGVGISCPTIDPLYSGQACATSADCPGGACEAGLCRCTSSAQCCSAGADAGCETQGYSCGAPPPTTPGSGNTCRASRPSAPSGITIDSWSRWTRARPVWTQAPWAVTHVNDDASVPRSSEWTRNWLSDSDGHRSTPSLGPVCLPLRVFVDGFEE